MAASRSAVPFRRTGRHRRPSKATVAVPTGVTGGLLLASAAVGSGVATAAPAAASEKPGAVTSSSSSSGSAGAATASQASSSSLPAYPGVLLERGDTGDYVEMVQEALGVATDGIFGPVTESAVVNFQQQQGITVDGIVGPETWAALRSSGGGNYGGSSASGSSVTTVSYETSSSSSLGAKAVEIASQQEGEPYQYGAAGPDAFDCSGLVKYVYGKLGYNLPHNAEMQYNSVNHVSRGDLRPGDIVFLADSSGIYHNGIYAGNGKWWVARHSGTTVTLQDAYWMGGDYTWYVGRVG